MARLSRSDRILAMTALDQGPGLEIAPLHRPIATKDRWDVRYVDIVSTPDLIDHYGDDPAVPNEDIVEVDFPLTGPDGVIRRLSEVASDASPFSWVLASHVIEHVPDLIAWLEDIATLLKDGGALVLAIPDTRYTFDAYRPQTTVGQMLQANHQGDVIPSVRAVYDYLRTASSITAADAWADRRPGLDGSRIHDLRVAREQAEHSKAGLYVDSHVWTFRPSTFIEQINELGQLGLCDFVVESLRNTRPGEIEFFAVLRRLPRDRTPEQDIEMRAAGKRKTNDERLRPTGEARTAAGPAGPAGLELSAKERQLIERKRAVVARARRVLRR